MQYVKIGTCVVLAAASCAALILATPQSGGAPHALLPVPNHEVTPAMLGLTAQVFASSGCSSTDVTGVLQRLEGAATLRADYISARAALSLSAVLLTAAQKAAAADPFDAELVSTVSQRRSEHDAARTAADQAVAALLADILDPLPTTVVERIHRARARQKLGLPAAYLALDISDEAAARLTAVLRHEQQAARRGFALPANDAILLSDVRATPEYIGAEQWVSLHLEAIRTLLHDG